MANTAKLRAEGEAKYANWLIAGHDDAGERRAKDGIDKGSRTIPVVRVGRRGRQHEDALIFP